MGRNKRLDTRPLWKKGVVAVGAGISRRLTRGKIIGGTGKPVTKSKKRKRMLPTVADVPAEIRSKVADIRERYRGWGQQKNSIAASRIIAACSKNKATVNLVMATMLRKPIHQELRDTIRKQL